MNNHSICAYPISIVVPSLNYGGAERVAVLLANEIAERGYKVSLVVLCEYPNSKGGYRDFVSQNVDVIEFKAERVRFALKNLYRYIRSIPESVIVSMGTDADLAVAITDTIARRKNIFIPTLHSTFSRENLGWLQGDGFMGKIKLRLKVKMKKIIYSKATAVVAVSNGVADDIKKFDFIDDDKVKVIYNPVVDKNLKELSLKSPNHKFADEAVSVPYFISVGRLDKAKNYNLLLRAFAKVNEKMKSRLIMLGDGEMRAELEGEISRLGLENSVSLPGFDKNPFAYMRKASAFVMSSDYEGFGNVIVEAMACGTTVVSTDCPSGPSEILENGKYGYLVPVGDENALAEAMLKAVESPFPQELLKQRASDFSVEKATDRYIELFDSLVKRTLCASRALE